MSRRRHHGTALDAMFDVPEQDFEAALTGAILVATAFPLAAMVLRFLLLTPLYYVIVVDRLIPPLCRTSTVVGEADSDAIAQSQEKRPARGEGLADILDAGEF